MSLDFFRTNEWALIRLCTWEQHMEQVYPAASERGSYFSMVWLWIGPVLVLMLALVPVLDRGFH